MAVIRGLNRRLLLIAGVGGIIALFFIFRGKDATVIPETGATFLAKIMDEHGGKKAWDSINKISFLKTFSLYKEDGSVEMTRNEKHSYGYTNGISRLVQWKQDEKTYNLVQDDNTYSQVIDGQLDTLATTEQLRNKMQASTFVLGLPYTLDTPTNELSYNGLKTFEGNIAHELEVRFQGSEDIWWLYYSEAELEWLGYWVKTSGHYSLVLNTEMIVENGFLLSRKRKSYRTDSLRNKTYLRAEYLYDNYAIIK
ncbi:hypothetical protein EAX61_10715 [Dokdonia sinensis]|uniref:Outer membrane lipoprotein-sorting protein n=1 Tax=Dokdonia sinensis TaxID=2479847 RepID=A0A3M0G7C2_9FLAO|nr:hypothetical protein [Dokdonia sinensis]RMB57583.1 hypothetical protein EAX61_10715 [Dokdonia sinensis]